MAAFANMEGERRMKGWIRFAGIIMAALAAGAAPSAYAADGWMQNAKITLVFASANGQLRIKTEPTPQSSQGGNFGCNQPSLILGFEKGLSDDDTERFALARMHDTALGAHVTGARVDYVP